ncbi:MAG TPA: phosphoesterase PA-phosphatase [Micromonosporaceae bacterium]|nr:phosphoesterase PA-phosphatase [Micromonosporaceae bacterium]
MPSQHATVRMRLARVVTEALAPAVLVSVLLVLLGWHSDGYRPRGLLWGAVAALFESVLPFTYILRGVRSGRLTDHHIGDRRQRRGPLLVGVGSVVFGVVVLVALGAARALLAAVVAGGVGLVVAAVVSHWWKMSIHTAVAAGSCVILALVFGPYALLALPLVVLVGWSRVQLTDHTVGQAVVGAVVGALVAGGVYAALR